MSPLSSRIKRTSAKDFYRRAKNGAAAEFDVFDVSKRQQFDAPSQTAAGADGSLARPLVILDNCQQRYPNPHLQHQQQAANVTESQEQAIVQQQHHQQPMQFFVEQDCGNRTAASWFSAGHVDGQPIETMMGSSFNSEQINFGEIEQVWLIKSWPEILARVAIVAPIVFLGFVGNLTIIYSMCKFNCFRSKPTNIFILNMALADLLTTIVCPNAALFTYIYQFYVLGAFICRFEGFIKVTCLLVSAYSLIVLSADWFLCVVQPCRTRITTRQSWWTLGAIWLLSIMMASPLFVWRKLRQRQWKDLLEVWCCEQIQYTKYYWLAITFCLIYLPTFIMTIVLIVILLQMDKFEAKLRRSTRRSSSSRARSRTAAAGSSSSTMGAAPRLAESHFGSSGSSLAVPSVTLDMVSSLGASNRAVGQNGTSNLKQQQQQAKTNSNQNNNNGELIPNSLTTDQISPSDLNGSLAINIKYRRRIMKILFTYLLSSIICWSPLQFSIIYRHFRSEPVPAAWFFELAFYTQIFASLSSAMNPVIFGYLSQPFRRIVTKSWMFRLVDKLLGGRSSSNSAGAAAIAAQPNVDQARRVAPVRESAKPVELAVLATAANQRQGARVTASPQSARLRSPAQLVTLRLPSGGPGSATLRHSLETGERSPVQDNSQQRLDTQLDRKRVRRSTSAATTDNGSRRRRRDLATSKSGRHRSPPAMPAASSVASQRQDISSSERNSNNQKRVSFNKSVDEPNVISGHK